MLYLLQKIAHGGADLSAIQLFKFMAPMLHRTDHYEIKQCDTADKPGDTCCSDLAGRAEIQETLHSSSSFDCSIVFGVTDKLRQICVE